MKSANDDEGEQLKKWCGELRRLKESVEDIDFLIGRVRLVRHNAPVAQEINK
jgi:DNA polymerase/3'-5' exonuclease PolX